MAIAEMRKLNLVAMSYDKDVILNALQRTGAVEVKLHADTENTVALPAGGEELRAYLASVEAALSVLSTEVENYNKNNNIKSGLLKVGLRRFVLRLYVRKGQKSGDGRARRPVSMRSQTKKTR